MPMTSTRCGRDTIRFAEYYLATLVEIINYDHMLTVEVGDSEDVRRK